MAAWIHGVIGMLGWCPLGKLQNTNYKLQKKEVSVSQRQILKACGVDVK
jgi:hypothetical protein